MHVVYFSLTRPAMKFDTAMGAKRTPRKYCQFSAVGAPSSPQEDFLSCSLLQDQRGCCIIVWPREDLVSCSCSRYHNFTMMVLRRVERDSSRVSGSPVMFQRQDCREPPISDGVQVGVQVGRAQEGGRMGDPASPCSYLYLASMCDSLNAADIMSNADDIDLERAWRSCQR